LLNFGRIFPKDPFAVNEIIEVNTMTTGAVQLVIFGITISPRAVKLKSDMNSFLFILFHLRLFCKNNKTAHFEHEFPVKTYALSRPPVCGKNEVIG
jgi:hypothetical protein